MTKEEFINYPKHAYTRELLENKEYSGCLIDVCQRFFTPSQKKWFYFISNTNESPEQNTEKVNQLNHRDRLDLQKFAVFYKQNLFENPQMIDYIISHNREAKINKMLSE